MNHKSIIILIILMLVWNESMSQTLRPGHYPNTTPVIIIDSGTLDFSFFLFHNGRYVLMFNNDEEGADFFWYIMLSRGKYRQKGTDLVLSDECFHFKMKAVTKEQSFSFVSAPNFLLNRTFKRDIYVEDLGEEPPYFSPYAMTKSDMSKHNKANKTDFDLLYGLYRENHMGMFDFILKIMGNEEYILTCNEYVFSKGKWKRQRNALVLTDDIGFHIRLLIKENRLFYKYEPDKYLIFKYIGI